MCDDAGVREPEVSAGTCLGSDSQPLYLPWAQGAGRFEHTSHHLLFHPKELLPTESPMEQRTRRATLILGLMYFLQSSWRIPWSRIVTASDVSPCRYAVCVGQWPQHKVAQHGRVLERSRCRRTGTSARDSLFQVNDFVKGPDGLWHPRDEFEGSGLHSVWSQVTDFPGVEFSLLQKRGRRVVICQKGGFGDDILLRESRALFRRLQVMVCGTRLRCTRSLPYRQHVLCPLHSNADAHEM